MVDVWRMLMFSAMVGTTTVFCHRLRSIMMRSNAVAPSAGPRGIRFGKYPIAPEQIFYRSNAGLTVAFVNLKPIVQGHVLVSPVRVVPKLNDLDDAEVCDLWRSVHHIAGELERHYDCSASNIAVQDGAAAGQTVPHVHVHVLPRRRGDFTDNDEVYDKLEEFDARRPQERLQVPKDEDRKPRTMAEMAEEATELRALFSGGEVQWR